MEEEEERKEELPFLYTEGHEIELKLASYRTAKAEVVEALRYLNYLISNIEGKLEECNRCMYGNLSLSVTSIRLSRFFGDNLVINEKDTKLIEIHVTWYNHRVKEDQFSEACVPLTDLKKILVELRDKKVWTFGIFCEDIERKAHTPIVIKAKKRKK